MNDYIMLVDESGQPYIAHAFWNRKKGSEKKNHKYIKKIDDGGKVRYFYTKEELEAYYKQAKEKVKEKVKELSGANKRDEALKARDDLINKSIKAPVREFNKEYYIKNIPYMPNNANPKEITDSKDELNPYWKKYQYTSIDGNRVYGSVSRPKNEEKSIKSLIDERKKPTTAQEMNRQMDLIDTYNAETERVRKEAEDAEKEFERLRKEYAKTPLGMIDIASNAVGYVTDKTKAAEEKRYAKRIDKDNWNMEKQVMELRGQGSTFHSNYSRKTGSVLTEDEYPYVTDAKKAIVNQANEILTQYKASTDKTERKKLESKLKKLQRDMKELVY